MEAINHGADAVYIGAPRFGARAAAGNSLEDIAALVRYAHLYNARIYVTVNTILKDDELQDTEAMIWDLYRAGVDALIVQDMGITRLKLPPIPLHASTQMDNRTSQKVKFLAEAGFRQARTRTDAGRDCGDSPGLSRHASRSFCSWSLVCELQRSVLRQSGLLRTQCEPWRVCPVLPVGI